MKRKIITLFACVFMFCILAACGDKSDDNNRENNNKHAVSSESTTNNGKTTKPIISTVGPEMTVSQREAFNRAKSFLSSSAFSYQSLIKQLESDGFSHEQVVNAVDNCGANWDEQIVKKAKNYLSYIPYSRQKLI